MFARSSIASRGVFAKRCIPTTQRFTSVPLSSRTGLSRTFTTSTSTKSTNTWKVIATGGALVGTATLYQQGVFGSTTVHAGWFNDEKKSGASTGATSKPKTPHVGIPGTRHERTFIAIKPDGVQRGLIGELIQRFERKGYKLVGMKMIRPTEEFASKHYEDLAKKPFFPGLVKFFSSGPVVAMVWEGKGAIKGGRALLGATSPVDAPAGSIRFDYCIEVGRNIMHGSDGPEGAAHEIGLWFNEDEIAEWEREEACWVYEKL